MTKSYVIYKVTNIINGKMYIGKTYNFEKRKREHLCDIDDKLPFHRALKKYGVENFKWEIIDYADTDEIIKQKEIYWIKKLNTCIHAQESMGYNITVGGEGGVSWNSKPVLKFSKEGYLLDEYMSCASADIANNIYRGAAETGCISKGLIAGFQWRFKEEVESDRIAPYIRVSEKKKGIIQLTKEGTYVQSFESVTKAANMLNINRTNISTCLLGKTKTCGGYQWKYLEEFDENIVENVSEYNIRNEIVQLDLHYNLIAIYFNCRRAARAINLENPKKQSKYIHKALSKKSHYAYGYLWYKKEDYNKNYNV